MTNFRFSIACWVTKAIRSWNMKYFLLFHGNIVDANAAERYVIRTLSVLF